MSKKPLCVAIMWHMHQPDYGNIQTGEIYLPWTRFHATKDYYDMGALVAETPGLRLTINLVPSLMDQLVAYSAGTAREIYAELTLLDAARLDEREKLFLLRRFFQLPYRQMVFPYPRYNWLLEQRGAADPNGEYSKGLRAYSIQDYRDLQVWFNLSWCGNELRRNPQIAALFRKGKGYTEDDKRKLIEAQFAFAGRILPLYRRLAEEHGIELSTSPYYHPILPLLCDNRAARESQPHLPMPQNPFSSLADAREQVRRAQNRFLQLTGRNAQGMWPSEGAISEMTAHLANDAGLRWLASDEGVLHNSLRKLGRAGDQLQVAQKYSVYRYGAHPGGVRLFFRDRVLSDLIGFTYARWQAEQAVADFLLRLLEIRAAVPDDGRHYVVAIILDGENAWENYPNNGADFLRLLYCRLTGTDALRPVTFSEFLDLEPHCEELNSIMAGSWIYANLATWIGHPEKNRGWEHLSAARGFLNSLQSDSHDPLRYGRAYQELLIAEGSDWFWWYGDDHSTQNAAEFDSLFRSHVMNVYRLMGQPSPPELDASIKETQVHVRYRNPLHTMTPQIDGRVTDYFEWLSAGFAIPGVGEAMHRNEQCLEKIFFGYDKNRFYLRLDLEQERRQEKIPAEFAFRVQFVYPRQVSLLLQNQGTEWRCEVMQSAAERAPEFAAGKILELAIPLEELGVHKLEEVRFAVSVYEKDRELERFPPHGYLTVVVDSWGLDKEEWVV